MKKNKLIIYISLIVFLCLFLYGNPFFKKTKTFPNQSISKNTELTKDLDDIKGESIITSENKSEEPKTKEQLPQKDSQTEKSAPPIISTETKNEIISTEQKDNEKTIETQNDSSKQDPNCTDAMINTYEQIISTSRSSISFSQNYINNPRSGWDYNYAKDQCSWQKSDCIEEANTNFYNTTGWSYQEASSHNCHMTGRCSSAIIKRESQIQQCIREQDKCFTDLETETLLKIDAAKESIKSQESLIQKNQDKIANCGIN